MRILHISTRLILGGSQENTVLSCEGQAERGHNVHLAFGPIYGPEGSLLERVEKFRTRDGRGITTHVVPHMVRDVHPLNDACAYRELRELVERLRPDVVHTHSSKAGILGRIAAWRAMESDESLRPDGSRHRLQNAAVIHTIHGPPFMPVEGSLLSRAKIALSNTVYEVAERLAADHCHTIVSVADAMTQQFLARGIGTPSQYVTVRSGMDVEPFLHAAGGEDRATMRAALGLSENDFVIGTVARLAQHKGHDDILDALAQDLRQHPTLKLLWVGDGWWRERLLCKALEMGIGVRELDREQSGKAGKWESENEEGIGRDVVLASPSHRVNVSPSHCPQLILTGLVPPTRIPSLMRAMDVLAHPSYREGLPRTVPQALLAGVFPIAYDCDGTGEVCVDMQTGRLVPTGNVDALRAAINWSFEHPAERRAMTAVGQQRCAKDFSTDAMVEGLEEVYEWALRRR
ncbi:MAG: glycosyltransferase [Phycisphaerales bacterium]